MRPKPLALALLVAAAAVPPGAAAQEGGGPAVPLVRMKDGHGSDLLFKVDPRTLKPLARPIRTFRGLAGLAFSPGGSRIAMTDGSGWPSRLQVVDLARWRSMGTVRLRRRGQLSVGWASEERVVAIAGEGSIGRQELIVIDAGSKRVVARRPFAGRMLNAVALPGGLALALAPQSGVGALRLLVVAPDGGVRAIAVDGIRAGFPDGERRGRHLNPGIAVDSEGGRAFVVAARGTLVAEVALASGAVSYHPLGASASKGNVDVWWRHAEYAGDGRLVVTGERFPPTRPGRAFRGSEPLGLRVINTRDWSVATLARRTTTAHMAGDTLLAHGTRWFGARRRPVHTGLLAFDGAGRRAYMRFRGLDIALSGSRAGLGYVWVRRTRRLHVIDLRDGRTLNEVRTGARTPFLLMPRP